MSSILSILLLILCIASTLSISDSSSATLSPIDISESSESVAISVDVDDNNDYDDGVSSEPVTDTISNEDLCECFDIDLVYTFIGEQNRVCYFYIFNRASTESFCSQTLDYIALETNANECNLNINDILHQYSPNCCINTDFSGTFIEGIQFIFNNDDIDDLSSVSSSVSSSDSSESFESTLIGSDSQSSDSQSSSDIDDSIANDDPVIFSLCFDASFVSGTQNSAQIEIKLGNNIFGCDFTNIVPDLCGNVSPTTTVASTTAEPTTAAPTTAAPTTANPTAVTPAPTTAAPTTTAPTTADPTAVTATPTTVAPTAVTIAPTLTPTFEPCSTDDAFNIAFLLDESGTLDTEEWQNQIEFVDRLIQYDIPATSYVSLFEFASLPDYSHFLDWTAVEDPVGSGDRSVFTDALDSNPYNPAGLTYTWDAVNRVLDEFWDYRFSCTDGCDTRSDVLIILTDGRPTDSVCPDMKPRVNQSDVDIIVVGIGLDAAAIDSISCLDDKDGGADILSVDSFDEVTLRSLELDIRESVCTGSDPAGSSVRPVDGTQWVYEDGSIGLGPIPTVDPDAPGDGSGDTR